MQTIISFSTARFKCFLFITALLHNQNHLRTIRIRKWQLSSLDYFVLLLPQHFSLWSLKLWFRLHVEETARKFERKTSLIITLASISWELCKKFWTAHEITSMNFLVKSIFWRTLKKNKNFSISTDGYTTIKRFIKSS